MWKERNRKISVKKRKKRKRKGERKVSFEKENVSEGGGRHTKRQFKIDYWRETEC
jgi:hypothetical protein